MRAKTENGLIERGVEVIFEKLESLLLQLIPFFLKRIIIQTVK